ncbi:MAG: DUF4215 domain-containing protein [Myxococcales bacterium]|nr:DUF4215 domain-containing protein [Myxococcales bacterium]
MAKHVLLIVGMVIGLAAGCLHDDLVDCADGTSCPVATVCHPLGCVAEAQLKACAGSAELASCSTERIGDGVCAQGVCVERGCGNRVVEPGEQCDDGNRFDRDGCAANCLSDETCGNNFVDSLVGERCDDGNRVSGDGCQADCELPRCGDSVIDAARNEQCDDGANNSDALPDHCRADCRRARCGDAIRDTGEQCDDGNTVNNDGCRNDCVLPSCGNGTIEPGEECDDGNVASNDGCQFNCKLPRCGDSIVDTGRNEQCDLGTAVNSDAPDAECRTDCRPRRCGDHIVDLTAGERCDDANNILGDGCRPDCSIERCGDGILDSGSEQCDDANTDPLDGCRNDCTRARCGDGVVDAILFEECDLGDAANSNLANAICRKSCRAATCGDGIIDTAMGEQCDDSNHVAGDMCSPSCKFEVCGNHNVDPGEECDDGNLANGDTCHNSCKVPRCGDGIKDLQLSEECDLGAANANTSGAACRTNCRLPICGDGVQDPGEVCDDGNLQVGDGCSSDCRSNETCGNRYLDFARGEECDDGSILSHDGCSSRCLLEFPRWEDVTPGVLTARSRHAAVYDPSRRRLVVFGGAPPAALVGPATLLADTWEYDGVAWVQRHPTLAPSARMDASMVYDTRKGLVYLFGGIAANGQRLDDLWMWNGSNWAAITILGTGPAARSDAAMAYDSGLGVLVLFGGRTATGYLGDTWILRDGAWRQLPPGGQPPARSGASVAYDPRIGGVMLHGGEDLLGLRVDTWVFRADAWEHVGDGPPRAGAAVAYDPSSETLFVRGGRSSPSELSNELWTWSYTQGWNSLGGVTVPPRENETLSAMFDLSIVVLVGGVDLEGTITDEINWMKNGNDFLLAPASSSPTPRASAGLAYDPVRGVTVMYGGTDGADTFPETWEWNGLSWRSRGAGPTGVYRPALVYEPKERVMLALGGSAQAQCLTTVQNTTTAWDGLAWTPRGTGPGGRRCAMATTHDAASGRPVAIGGFDGAATRLDAYSYSGGAWTAQPAMDMSRAIDGRTLAYEATTGALVQYGAPDTWDFAKLEPIWFRFTGGWNQLKNDTGPPPRGRNAFLYDPNRAVVTAFGGQGLAGPLGDVWTVDPTDRWTQVQTSVPINYGAETPEIAYHDAIGGFVAISPPTLGATSTTFTMRYESRTPDEACRLPLDRDGDGKLGSEDPDCWPYFDALCPPCAHAGCAAGCSDHTCGDGKCAGLETARTCPADCGGISARCGDLQCDGEVNCPGDCP